MKTMLEKMAGGIVNRVLRTRRGHGCAFATMLAFIAGAVGIAVRGIAFGVRIPMVWGLSYIFTVVWQTSGIATAVF